MEKFLWNESGFQSNATLKRSGMITTETVKINVIGVGTKSGERAIPRRNIPRQTFPREAVPRRNFSR